MEAEVCHTGRYRKLLSYRGSDLRLINLYPGHIVVLEQLGSILIITPAAVSQLYGKPVLAKNPDNRLKNLLTEVIILEGLVNLDRLKQEKVTLIALPLKVQGGDGSPVRAVAIEEKAD